MGSAIALRERKPFVPNTPESNEDLSSELRTLANDLNVENVLGGLKIAIQHITDMGFPKGFKEKEAAEYILVLDAKSKNVIITPFTKDQLPKADAEYLRSEMESQDKPYIQVVRVSVEDIHALRIAYPNYYLDTNKFLEALRFAISK